MNNRKIYWQRRNHHPGHVGCDHCSRTVSEFRVRFAEFGIAVWLCIACAERNGVDLYQPCYPVKACDELR